MPDDIKTVMAPLEGSRYFLRDVLRAANTGYMKLSRWRGWDDGICPAYSSGKCTYNNCKAAHLYKEELPTGYTSNFCTVVDPGVKAYVQNPEGFKNRRYSNGGRRA